MCTGVGIFIGQGFDMTEAFVLFQELFCDSDVVEGDIDYLFLYLWDLLSFVEGQSIDFEGEGYIEEEFIFFALLQHLDEEMFQFLVVFEHVVVDQHLEMEAGEEVVVVDPFLSQFYLEEVESFHAVDEICFLILRKIYFKG